MSECLIAVRETESRLDRSALAEAGLASELNQLMFLRGWSAEALLQPDRTQRAEVGRHRELDMFALFLHDLRLDPIVAICTSDGFG